MKTISSHLMVFSLLALACGPIHEGKPGDQAVVQPLQFESIRTSIFDKQCSSCHLQYNDYNAVKREVDDIWQAINTNRMPKGRAPLSEDDKKLLRDWIDAGSPKDTQMKDKNETPDLTLSPQWQALHALILLPRCIVCHNPAGEARFLDLSTRQSIFSARNREFIIDTEKGEVTQKLINFETPLESYLLTVINDPDEPMPPTRSRIRRLTNIEIDTMEQWISLGMP